MKIKILFISLLCFGFLSCTQNKPNQSMEFYNWASSPPMGWNSWDCYGPTVVEAEVKANADYMAEYLKEYGWKYVVVDIRWYVENDKAHGYNEKDPVFVMDEFGRFLPSPKRFPSSANGKGFKPLADYIHGKGLKFGIHIMRGIPKEAVRKNTPVLGSKAKAADIYNKEQLCPWLGDMFTVEAGHEGAQEYYNSLFNLYASWGVDFIKVDDLTIPYHQKEIEMIRKAIDQAGREIVLSTSPGETPFDNAEHIKVHANMWRIVGDFWDNWPQLKEHFVVCNRWSSHVGNGHFPDADMLPLGRIGIRAENGDDRMSMFSKDEQISLMTLFSIFRSPLMFGGDLPSTDSFTLSLLTNKEVLDVNKYSQNNRELFRRDDLIVWVADDPKTGDKYLALFNIEDQVPIIDSKAIWKSDTLSVKSGKTYSSVKINLSNSKKLYLAVSDGGNGTNWDHADWIEPKLSGKNGTINLTTLPSIKATAGWGKVRVNKSVADNPLVVNGKEYSDGFGTHSNSVIEFDIPEGFTQLSATVGLDRECLDHPEGATVQFMVFTDDPSGEKPADSVKITVAFSELGLDGEYKVSDLWSHQDIGTFTGEFAPEIRNHGAGLFRLSKK